MKNLDHSLTVRIVKDNHKIQNAITLLEMYNLSVIELTNEIELEFDNKEFKPGYCYNESFGWFLLTDEKLNEILNHYYNRTILLKENIDTHNRKIKKLNALMTKTISLEIYCDIKLEIQEHETAIYHLQEELESTEFYRRRWRHSVKNVLIENEGSYLYYHYSS